MTTQLELAIRQPEQQLNQPIFVELARFKDSDARDLARWARDEKRKASQQQTLHRGSGPEYPVESRKLSRPAQRQTGLSGQRLRHFADARQKVQVLMTIEMIQLGPQLAGTRDLSLEFSPHLIE